MIKTILNKKAALQNISLVTASLLSSVAMCSEDIVDFYGEEFVTLATGNTQLISKAPAVATVITREEIDRMGAVSLVNILETVPGFHSAYKSGRMTASYGVRGIHVAANQQVLFLLNGIALKNMFLGDRGATFRMPVSQIERIEVIRGPGSALYGADAFTGVVNIITRSSESEHDTKEVSAGGGSFDSSFTNLSTAKQGEKIGFFFNVDYYHTNGDDERIIERDAQTALDSSFSTSASHAPGPIATQEERLSAHLGLDWEDWSVKFSGTKLNNAGQGAGLAKALDPKGHVDGEDFLVDVTNRQSLSNNDNALTTKAYYRIQDMAFQHTMYPAGTVLPIGSNGNINTVSPAGFVMFSDGLIANPSLDQDIYGIDFTLDLAPTPAHALKIGAGYQMGKVRAGSTQNFGPGIINGTEGVVDGTLTDVTGTPHIYVPDHDRESMYTFAQDEWQIAPDWTVTAGGRYDHFTDFSGTFNPRMAAVWQATRDTSVKLLYGRAFRAPSVSELFLQNNPVLIGNPNLKPETIDNVDIGFSTRWSDDLQFSANVYYFEIRDAIRLTNITSSGLSSSNFGEITGQGFEVQSTWQAADTLDLSGNYAHQNAQDKYFGGPVGEMPRHHLKLIADWKVQPRLVTQLRVNWVADRTRTVEDTRPKLDDYIIVDAVVKYKLAPQSIELTLSALNVFDEDAREPSGVSSSGPQIPGDFPIPGRSVILGLKGYF